MKESFRASAAALGTPEGVGLGMGSLVMKDVLGRRFHW